jgi:hypothetical protein
MNHAPGAQKKSASLHQAAENPVETIVRQIALPHIDFYGQGTLPSPTAGCRIRFPESLLMLVSL